MNITEEQKSQLQGWLNESKSLSDIHKEVTEGWGLSMTYMDLRFLIDDLDLQVVDKEEPVESEEPGEPTLESTPTGSVSVAVDKITRPGALVSGNVTFKDGESAGWQLDQAGRLGLMPSTEGYKPSQEDVQEFQASLQQELAKAGF